MGKKSTIILVILVGGIILINITVVYLLPYIKPYLIE